MPLDQSSPPSDSSSPYERIGRAAGLTSAATLASRVLGLARDTVVAARFGAGNDMDAFNVAFRIPNLVRDLFAEGALSAAFVPTFARRLAQKGKPDAWKLGNSVLNTLFLVTASIVVVGWLFTTPIVSIYAGGYAEVPGKLELTVRLSRAMLPFMTLIALAAAIMGMLNSLRHYFVPALAPAAFNVAAIACALGLGPLMPSIGQPPIMALAVGIILGGLGQIAAQWPTLRREGFRYVPEIDLRDQGLHEVLKLMGPGAMGLAATQINVLVNTLLATTQGTGAVSWLQYAFRLIYLPIGLFGVSIATAILPSVAQQTAIGDLPAARQTLTRGLALMLIVNVPATVGLLIFATPIVRLLLERGHFVPSDTAATAAAVQCYALGLLGYSTARICLPVFYALGRSRVAVALSSASVLLNVVLSLLLVRWLGYRGLALATSFAAIANGMLALALLQRHLGRFNDWHLAATLAKSLVCSAAMGIASVWVLQKLTAAFPGAHTMLQAVRLVLAIFTGLIVLAASAFVLRVTEVIDAFNRIRDWQRTRPPHAGIPS